MSAVEIRLLGELAVVRGGRAIALPASKKTRALLAYLVATGRPHLREKLCELLWPGPDDPRAALRWSLTKIRALLDDKSGARVVADRERVAFEAKGAKCDLGEVRTALASGACAMSTDAMRDVAARFRGELFEGLDLPDAFRFHEWCVGEREAARAMRVSVLSALVARLEHEPETAVRYARERVAIDPLSEAAHVALVALLTRLGKRREAQQQADTCTRILANELNAKPSPALLAAKMAITGSSAPPPAVETHESDAPPPIITNEAEKAAKAPLLGREEACALIGDQVEAGAAAKCDRVLLFVGEPGIGKSRLLDEVAARVRARGGAVLRGRAYEAEMVRPYGAWIDALRSASLGAIDETMKRDLAPLLPELQGAASDPGDRSRLFDAVTRLLAERTKEGTPLAVILDDVQWFDEASAALLHYAARALAPSPVVFACGARREELADNMTALRLVRALTRDERLCEIDVKPLDAKATAALARAIDARVDVDRVVRESAGNPLFAIEIARALGSRKTKDETPLAESLSALIADRLSRLDANARELVPWAAAIGHTFGLELLERVTGIGAGAIVDALDVLERRGIVRASANENEIAYDFVHDLIRAGAYRQLSAARLRLVHLQIARALEATRPADGTLAGDIAHHAALGGDRLLAARAYLEAGERALRIFAHAEAARLANAGAEHARVLPREERLAIMLDLYRVNVMSMGWKTDRRVLEREMSRALVEARDAGLHEAVSRGFHVLSILQRDGGDLEAAGESTLLAAEAVRRSADREKKALQLSDTARCLALLEREVGQAQQMLHEAQAILGEASLDNGAFAWGLGLVRAYRGDYSGASALLERAMLFARRNQDHWAECEGLIKLIEVALDEGEAAKALTWCHLLAPVAAKMGEGSEVPVGQALLALAHVASGDASSWSALDRAIETLREIDAKGILAYVLTCAAAIDLAESRIEKARARAEEALRAAEIVNRRTRVLLAHALLGKAELAEGNMAAAMLHLDAIRGDLVLPLGVSARARAAAFNLASALDTPIHEGGSP